MRARLRLACSLCLCVLGTSTGCERLLSIRDPVTDDAGTSDTGTIDGAVLGASSPVLLSEVVLTPTEAEMIEIVNTSNQPIDLSTYYLSDSGTYYRLPADKTVDPTDFIVKFPAGAMLKGHGVMVIAIDTPTHFNMQFPGVAADYSVADDSMVKIAMNGTPNLTNSGEPIILFQWDGVSDVVRDVDIVIVGSPTATNALPSKSGALQDGPDPGSDQTRYAVDAGSIKPQASAPGTGVSTHRIALEVGHETQTGAGNGQSGDDETSEDTSMTWDGTQAHPFTAPTPGQVPPELTP